MSLASDYAAAVAADAAGRAAIAPPTPWGGPGGLMTASVSPDGNGSIAFGGSKYPVPGSVLLSFAAWIEATFG